MKKLYNYDKKSDSLFIYIKSDKEERFEEIVPGINVEFDKKGEIIGIEVLKASRFSESLRKRLSKVKISAWSALDFLDLREECASCAGWAVLGVEVRINLC